MPTTFNRLESSFSVESPMMLSKQDSSGKQSLGSRSSAFSDLEVEIDPTLDLETRPASRSRHAIDLHEQVPSSVQKIRSDSMIPRRINLAKLAPPARLLERRPRGLARTMNRTSSALNLSRMAINPRAEAATSNDSDDSNNQGDPSNGQDQGMNISNDYQD